MRSTGIPIIGNVPWGTHLCQFYQDRQDLIDILIPYFKAGLEHNEFCIWVTSEPLRAEEASAALAAEVGGLDGYIRKGQLEIVEYSDWYAGDGKFESDRVLRAWVGRLEAAIARGFDGLRLSGNTLWLEHSDWQDFTEYEAAVNDVIGQYRMLAVCTYSLAKCGAAEIMDVVSNHAFALIKRSGKWQIVESAERKKAEAALHENEERLRMAAAVAGLGTWEFDLQSGRLVGSDFYKRHFGLSPDAEISYEKVMGAMPPGDRERVHRLVQDLLGGGTAGRYAAEYRTIGIEDGQERWIASIGRAFFDQEGRAVRVIGTSFDITARRRAEERIRHDNAVLKGLNRILQAAIATDTEEQLGRKCLAIAEEVTQSKFGFIAEVNSEGRLEDIGISDPGWEACRIENSAGLGRRHHRFNIHGIYGRVTLDGRGFYTNDPASHPDRLGTPAGHPPLAAFLGAPLQHDGRTIGMIAVANREGGYRPQDLEALEALAVATVQVLMRARAERALHEREERLRHAQKMESIGVLAGGIAHDFNNLLTSILGNASLLQLDGQGDRARLDAIVKSSEKAGALTRQLLAYAGKGKFHITDFDVARLLRSSPDLIRLSIPKHVEIHLDVPRNLPSVRGDSSQIQQVVMNLLMNGAEAIGDRSGGRVSIKAALQNFDRLSASRIGPGLSAGRYIVLSVEDNGCGMSEETRAKIFDPFFTTKFTGRGLGLAAVHGILASHKGAIAVQSRLGQGSTFTVYLPASDGAAANPPADAVAPGTHAATVLVVEDEESVRVFISRALERMGHRVVDARNGQEALDLLRTHPPVDLVILDIVMPVLGGVETFAAIRKRWPDLPFLIVSGYSEQEARRLGLPGGVPFLEKPYTMQSLAAALQKTLNPA